MDLSDSCTSCRKQHFVDVLVSAPIDDFYTYINNTKEELSKGAIVSVPFGSRTLLAVVWDVRDFSDRTDLKEIITVHQYPPLEEGFLSFIDKVATYNLIKRGNVLRMVLSEPSLFKPIKSRVSPVNLAQSQPQSITLSQMQQTVADEIFHDINKNKFSVLCIDGVTGSGKTEVFLKACERVLNMGKQCLIMLPEIALTPQLINRFTKYFATEPLVWHSSLTPKMRRVTWNKVVQKSPCVVIATRSGLFLPFSNLGLIVLDEEHDQSFKQEEPHAYNGRDMSILRAKILDIPVILSSATLSVETINNCNNNKYKRLHLTSRFSQIPMPAVEMVDMRAQANSNKIEWLSQQAIESIKQTINAGKQVLIYMNRRGYAPLTMCRKCGYRVECPNCTSWLVEHSKYNVLVCHYCGHQIPKIETCPKCSEQTMFAYGVGVERIEKELIKKIPQAKTIVASSDTLSTPAKISAVYEDILNCHYNVLIATQIFSKGHHFPKMSLVLVVDADGGLYGVDPRANERTYQAIQQVAGRAGRSHAQGKVIIQTYNPEHPFFNFIKNNDFEGFIAFEIENRKRSKMPPHTKLASITISSNNPKEAESYANKLVCNAPCYDDKNLQILGPAQAVVTKLHGRTRWKILLRASKNYNIQGYILSWLKPLTLPKSVRLNIDIDPYNFL